MDSAPRVSNSRRNSSAWLPRAVTTTARSDTAPAVSSRIVSLIS